MLDACNQTLPALLSAESFIAVSGLATPGDVANEMLRTMIISSYEDADEVLPIADKAYLKVSKTPSQKADELLKRKTSGSKRILIIGCKNRFFLLKWLCLKQAPVAQWLEHRAYNAGVPGSNPGGRILKAHCFLQYSPNYVKSTFSH